MSQNRLTFPKEAQVPHPWQYTFTKHAVNTVSGLSRNLVIGGQDNLSEEGPVIYLPKHISYRDVPVVATAIYETTGNTVYQLAKEQLFKIGFIGWWLRRCGAIKYNRKGISEDPDAQRMMGEVLEAGSNLVIYPEGTRTRNFLGDDLHERGLAMLAIIHGAGMHAVGLKDTEKWTGKNAVYFGPDLNPDRVKLDMSDRRQFSSEARKIAGAIRPALEEALYNAEELLAADGLASEFKT